MAVGVVEDSCHNGSLSFWKRNFSINMCQRRYELLGTIVKIKYKPESGATSADAEIDDMARQFGFLVAL